MRSWRGEKKTGGRQTKRGEEAEGTEMVNVGLAEGLWIGDAWSLMEEK